MNSDPLFFVSVLSILLVASLSALIWKLNEVRDLHDQQRQWQAETRRWQDLQGSFLANMSHELRTPLAIIKGYIEILESSTPPEGLPTKFREALTKIRKNADFLEDILNAILDFSKIKVGLRKTIKEHADIHDIFSDLLPDLQEKAQSEKLTFEVDIKEDVPMYLKCDAVAIRQIVRNLVENAVKFTSKGGIRVEVTWLPTDQNSSEGELNISVIDTGVGISLNYLERIFDPFVQVESSMSRRYGGTGLGLAISRGLAVSMGGSLVVTSRMGAGSRFDLRVPASVDMAESEHKERVEKVEPANERPSKKILLVEDSQDARDLVIEYLTSSGLKAEFIMAENGKEAVEIVTKAESEHRPIDLILMDMQMPVMNGYQATRLLRQRGFQKPIIALTAHNLQGDREKCMQSGCSDFIPKPVDWQVLIGKLKSV